MDLIISHVSSDAGGHHFVVVRQADGRRGEEVILTGPESIQVPDRPDKNLIQDLRWYLEDFLEYPFSPDTVIAANIVSTLEQWGKNCFSQLFASGNPALWYGEARNNHLRNLTLKIASEDPAILAWPWEALVDGNSGLFLANNVRMERQLGGKLPDPPPLPPGLPQDRLNILLVIARPYGERDVGYHAVSRPLVELAREDSRVRVEVLRPPSFDRLREVLQEREGFFHIVHFDGHGGYGDDPSSVTSGRVQGCLVFEKETGEPDAIPASEINNLLFQHGIPYVVLNACRSGALDQRAENPFASVAASLIRAGVRGVVAMGYSLHVSGAQQFVPALYRTFFKTGSLAEAVRVGREQMMVHPERVCALGTFPLKDFLVPVLYQQDLPRFSFHEVPRDQGERANIIPKEGRVQGDFGFIGRDRAILALERAILNQPQGAILIHGMAGVGKTTLAQGLLEWFADTGGLQHPPVWLAFDGIRSAGYVINQLEEKLFQSFSTPLPMAEKLDRVTAELKKNRHIVVWDNFESASGIEGTAISPLLPPEDRQLLKKLIQNICRGKSKIIITSRSREEWLSIIHCFSISLDGLVGEERWHYCNEVVKLLGLRPDRDNAVFQTLMDKLEGHPLAMRAILLRLDEKNARQLLVELEMGFKGKGGDESTEKIHQALGIFAAVLPENFAPVLQFIGLHQRFVDVDYLEPMAETVKLNLSRSQIDPCLFALERGGMLHHVGNGIHRMHPALSGYLAARHPAEAGVLRGFVTVMATLADQLTPKELHEQRGWFQIHEENCYHALSLAPESGFELAVPALTQSLAAWALNNRDWESAKRLFLALRDFRHQRGHHEGEAGAYHQLGRIAEELRHWAEAEGWYRKSLEIKERQGNEHGAASSYHQLGIVAQEQRQWAAAEGWYRKSLEIEERQGNEHGAASSYHQLGRIAEEQGHWAEAEEWYRKALKIYKRYEDAHNANIVQGSQKRLAALRET